MSEITLNEAQLEILLARASKAGAQEALAAVGLHDETARDDIKDIRGLLTAWRDTRSVMWKTILQAGSMALIVFISIAVWTHFRNQIR